MNIKGNVSAEQTIKGKLKDIPYLDKTLTKEGYSADAKAVGDALNGKSPSTHTHTASEVGARPNTWMPTASDVGARPNTWLPAIAEIGAAPAGYGLGETVSGKNRDANAVTGTGWHNCDVNTPDSSWWYGQHIQYDNGYAYQRFVRTDTGYVVERTQIAGVWQPWEWVNPPMELGIEYRTTERYDGKPVYAKRINQYYPSLGGSGIVDTAIPHEITEFEEIVRCDANISEYTLPVLWSDTQSMSVFKVDATNITLRIINDNWNPCNFRFTLYYTKQ